LAPAFRVFRHFKSREPARDRLPAHAGLSAHIASGGSAGVTPTCRCISKASSTTWLAIVDLADPAKPVLAGHWWLPGMWRAGGETPPPSFGKRTALHHMITAGNLGYSAWRDGGYTIHNLSDPVHPKAVVPPQTMARPSAAARTHRCPAGRKLLVLADEATTRTGANGLAYTWVIDVRSPDNPVSIATLPTPDDEDFCAKGAKFGPHNLHENRPGSMQTEDLIFATYHNAGLRIYDIRDAFQPKQVGYFVPPPPERIVDQRPNPTKSSNPVTCPSYCKIKAGNCVGEYMMQWGRRDVTGLDDLRRVRSLIHNPFRWRRNEIADLLGLERIADIVKCAKPAL